MNVLTTLQQLQVSVNKKKIQSQSLIESFSQESDAMIHDFMTFKDSCKEKSETYVYWDGLIQMVCLLKDLIRADRKGNWALHLHSVQECLPLFTRFDNTDYLRWCSLYLEDMRQLENTAPEIFKNFTEGKFVVKSLGHFSVQWPQICALNKQSTGVPKVLEE